MFAEEREDLPQEPEGAPGEPGEATPSETAPEAGEDAAPAAEDAAEGAPDEAGEEPGAIGPEIEGIEELTAQPEIVGEQPSEGAGEEPPEAAAEEPPEEVEEAEPAAPAVAEAGAEAVEGEPAGEEAPRERRPKREKRGKDEPQEEVIPGAHLEPDLVLEEPAREESEFGQYAEVEDAYAEGEALEEPTEEAPAEPAPVAHTPIDLAADARYISTGKRKSAIARVILKPGEGTYSVNGRHLDEYFPRVKLQRVARQPLEAAGYQTRMDVVARIHGGGVSAQAVALRHGVARALVEADPALRGELKRRGYLTRDPRVKERKKAGLKKARKRPQFSKR
jgi:small subunit ribosomal protein S9